LGPQLQKKQKQKQKNKTKKKKNHKLLTQLSVTEGKQTEALIKRCQTPRPFPAIITEGPQAILTQFTVKHGRYSTLLSKNP